MADHITENLQLIFPMKQSFTPSAFRVDAIKPQTIDMVALEEEEKLGDLI